MTVPADDEPARETPSGPSARGPAWEAFSALPLGVRVVVRYRIDGGATDVLGSLTRISDSDCDVLTRHGTVTVMMANIVAAKQIPPAPPDRRRR